MERQSEMMSNKESLEDALSALILYVFEEGDTGFKGTFQIPGGSDVIHCQYQKAFQDSLLKRLSSKVSFASCWEKWLNKDLIHTASSKKSFPGFDVYCRLGKEMIFFKFVQINHIFFADIEMEETLSFEPEQEHYYLFLQKIKTIYHIIVTWLKEQPLYRLKFETGLMHVCVSSESLLHTCLSYEFG